LQRAPHVALQVDVLLQLTVQSSPHSRLQFGPLLHERLQLSAHFALQSLEKLLHVGAHFRASPQSRLQTPSPFPHAHEAAVQATPVPRLLLEHATRSANDRRIAAMKMRMPSS
jgi:hypothetical protein